MRISTFITRENHLFAKCLLDKNLAQCQKVFQERIDQFSKRFCDSRFRILPYPLLFPYQTFMELSKAATTIFEIKKQILSILRKRWTPPEITSFLGLPETLADSIEWGAIENSGIQVARHDLVVDQSGAVKFIEMFFGSPCSGSAAFNIVKHFQASFQASSLNTLLTQTYIRNPDEDLARCLQRAYKKHNCSRIVALDSTQNKDYLDFTNYALTTIRTMYPELELVLRNENTWPESSPEQDLIYRILPFEDIQNHRQLQHHLKQKAPQTITGFECEVLSTKIWFQILSDPEYTSQLTDHQIETIEKYLPATHRVTKENTDQFTKNKNGYIFKDSWSSGGRKVLVGKNHTQQALRQQLAQKPAGAWIAQDYIASAKIPVLDQKHQTFEDMQAVFGLFQVDSHPSGLLVRAHPTHQVVNIARGAGMGWALPYNKL